MAQIHRAALPDGTEVIVKVRRPGAAEAVESDMRILHIVATVAQALLPPILNFLKTWAASGTAIIIVEQHIDILDRTRIGLMQGHCGAGDNPPFVLGRSHCLRHFEQRLAKGRFDRHRQSLPQARSAGNLGAAERGESR